MNRNSVKAEHTNKEKKFKYNPVIGGWVLGLSVIAIIVLLIYFA